MVIYGKEVCPFCVKAKKFCDEQEMEYRYIDIEKELEHRQTVIDAGMRSVPCIFDGDELIGGYSELIAMYGIF
jgi:glutaredoxin